MRGLIAIALLSAVALAASACGSSHPASLTVNSSKLILDGTVRCTATMPTAVRVGQDIRVAFTFRNVSKRTVDVQLAPWALGGIVKSPDGTTYDTRVALDGIIWPLIPPRPIKPGATRRESLRPFRVRWQGPLRITPTCGQARLRPVAVAVTAPGLPASQNAALQHVVAATGHLLDHCRPRTPGVSVDGRIDAPDAHTAPLRARCSVTLRQEHGFDVAQVLVLTPPGLKGIHVEAPYDDVAGADLGSRRNTQAIAWQFVVTRNGARSVASGGRVDSRPGRGVVPSWAWSPSGPFARPDEERCGTGGTPGGTYGPEVWFVSACGR